MVAKVVGSDGTVSLEGEVAAIRWAVDNGARVINLSLGGTFGSTVADAVKYATAKGVLVVAAAGNNGNSAPFYPAADPGVLSVAATQPDDTLYSWSDYGSWVAVAAPGCNVTTGLAGGFGGFCGTSASTPVVSGLAALAWSFAPGASADAITSAITTSAYSLRSVEYGRVDAAGTLAALGATFQPAPQAPVAPAPQAQPAAAAPPVSTAMSNAGVTRATVATHQRRRRQLRRIHTVPLLRRIPLALFGRSH
jgi:subtilisin family serine protease